MVFRTLYTGETSAVKSQPINQQAESSERGQPKVKYASICIARFAAKRFKCAQTWITQFYLQITPCRQLGYEQIRSISLVYYLSDSVPYSI